MYPYTKELTLDEALKLDSISNFCTALDYATHILGQDIPPEGWGYAAYDEPEKYDGLAFISYDKSWSQRVYGEFYRNWDKWSNFAFRLKDLAKVEAEPKPLNLQSLNELADTAFENKPVTEMEKTEINAVQIEWLLAYPSINKHWVNGKEYMCLSIVDVGNAGCAGIKYEILTSDYNSLPDEFKALAEPKSKAPSYVEFICDKIEATDWKAKYEEQAAEIAKFIEIWAENDSLKLQVIEATKSADLKQDKIHDLEHYKSISDNYVKALEAKLNAIEALTSAQWNLNKAHSDYYPY
jgi:hypothetical protein